MGTALIGVLLLIGIFGGLTASIETSDLSGNMTTEQIRQPCKLCGKNADNTSTEHTPRISA